MYNKVFNKHYTYAKRRLRLVFFIAKICTVPLSLEQHRNSESLLKFMLETKKNVSTVLTDIKCGNNNDLCIFTSLL